MSDALLDAILASPDDDEPRLVWADRTGGERGELVIIQCALDKRDPQTKRRVLVDRAKRKELFEREQALLQAFGAAWSGLADVAERTHFERGFVTSAAVPLEKLHKSGLDTLFAEAPFLREISLTTNPYNLKPYGDLSILEAWGEVSSQLERLFSQVVTRTPPHPHPLRSIIATPVIVTQPPDYGELADRSGFGNAFTARLVESAPLCEALESLALHESNMHLDVCAGDLAKLAALTSLGIVIRDAEDPARASAQEILRILPRLKHFAIEDEQLRGKHLAAFFASPEARKAALLSLHLGTHNHHIADLIAMANAAADASGSLAHIESLHLGLSHALHDRQRAELEEGFEAFAKAPHLVNLRDLDMSYGGSDKTIDALAHASFASRLERLTVRYGQLTPRSLPALLEGFPSLEFLDVISNRALASDLSSITMLSSVIPQVRTS